MYPIPFNQLFQNESMRYVNFGLPDDRFDPFVGLGRVDESVFRNVDYIFVTGSSSNHIFCNINAMYSFLLTDIRVSIVFVDFGLTNVTMEFFLREISQIQSLYQQSRSPGRLFYRKFDFSHFPDWYDIDNVAIRGGYSWKVISYGDVLEETHRLVLWFDSGNQVRNRIYRDLNIARTYGLFTPYSGGALGSWLYPASAHFLKSKGLARKVMLGKDMCTGGYLYIDPKNETVMYDVFYPLLQCAYTRKCITPIGSSRKNHRQDQAILTALVYSAKIQKSCRRGYRSDVIFHQECDTEATCLPIKDALIQRIEKRWCNSTS